MARQRITEDFVKYFKLLKERSGNLPHNIRRALERDPQIAISINELDTLSSVFEWHENHSKSRFIVQAHPEFSKAWKDYRERWKVAWITLKDWEAEKAGQETLTAWLERALSERADNKESSVIPDELEDWAFDPSDHSAAEHVEEAFEYIGYKADDEAFYSRAKGAWDWLVNTVGLDLDKIQERWREFGLFIVPEHVSNVHGLSEPKSLYRYLTDIRLAYMIGADLAAIAMCRAATEILIRYHYNDDSSMNLTPLVKETQRRREFGFLKQFNLVQKIDDANNILHLNEDIKNADRNRAIVRDWVDALRVMIDNAPRSREHTDHG